MVESKFCPYCGFAMNYAVEGNVCYCSNRDCNYWVSGVTLRELQEGLI